MATINVILKKDYQSKDNTYPIIIKVKHGKKQKVYNTKYKATEAQFKNGIVTKHPDASIINSVIDDKVSKAKKYFAECAINGRTPNLNVIFEERQSQDFLKYIQHRAEQYKKNRQETTSVRLERLVFELTDCFGSLYMDEITSDKLREYESYLKESNGSNTIAKKFKTLRQLFQAALDEGLYAGANPLRTFKSKTVPVKKEKLTPQEIKRIEDLDLSGPVNDARNLFLFSYYAKGVRFENCIFLKHSQIRDGRIHFKTNKGEKNISVLITSKLKRILDQYPGKGFVFPGADKDKDSINSIVNRNLKIVQGLAGINTHLTFHLSRHSIAYHLKQSGVNINAIKDILAHSDTKTTEYYLKALDDEQLDDEMKKVYGE